MYNLWLKDRERAILSTFAEWEACLLELVETYSRTTIVMDALDACNKEHRLGLINLLARLTNRGEGTAAVKFFVASRLEDDVCRNLEKYHLIQMQGEHNAEDIAIFVRTKLAEHPRWSRLSHDFQKDLVDRLLEKSENMFLFVRDALQRRLATLPYSLKATYEEIFQSAISDPDEGKFVIRALQWVLCSVKPLPSIGDIWRRLHPLRRCAVTPAPPVSAQPPTTSTAPLGLG